MSKVVLFKRDASYLFRRRLGHERRFFRPGYSKRQGSKGSSLNFAFGSKPTLYEKLKRIHHGESYEGQHGWIGNFCSGQAALGSQAAVSSTVSFSVQ